MAGAIPAITISEDGNAAMPVAIILAGPNGAGKTTFASAFLSAAEENPAFVNADEIAREASLSSLAEDRRNIQAARLMLRAIDGLVERRGDFMFETTLATLTYARRIPLWQLVGYTVALLYLRLPSRRSFHHARQATCRRGRP
jgi:predicted ABC-type ATPase